MSSKSAKQKLLSLLLAAALLMSSSVISAEAGSETLPETTTEALEESFSTEESSMEESTGVEESTEVPYTDIFISEWYRNGYAQGLYRNRSLDYTVGYKFQNETISNILLMAEDPILAANGWNLSDFFDGTVFKEIDIETLKELQAEGIEDLGYFLEVSPYALASSYTLSATASDEYKNFSMDLYDDVHGTLYQLTLGDHTVYCINYGKHSPKGTTYSKKTIDDYLTTKQQEVLSQCYFFWLYCWNIEYGNSSVKWGSQTNFKKIAPDSMSYLFMQISTWAAMKGCDFLGCVDAVRDTVLSWDSANTWGDSYYNWAVTYKNNGYLNTYTVNMGVYSSGNSENQNMLVFDHGTISLTPPDTSGATKSKVSLTKSDNLGSKLTNAGFTLYEWNGSSYKTVGTLTHKGSGVYESGIVIDVTTTNKGKYRIAETTVPAGYVDSGQYIDFNIAEQLITYYYKTFLGRNPDAGGLADWTSKLTSGTSEQVVMRSIANSTEANKYLSTNNAYTKALYDSLLLRAPTTDNYSYWNTMLTDGTYTRTTMFDFFWNHADHQNNLLAGKTARLSLSYTMSNTKQGKIKITKSSGNTNITSGNSNYALTSAKYGVYSDSACKTLVTTLTTNTSGTVTSGWLDPGTYYVKEITASKGYGLDTTAHKVTVKTNATASVSSSEPPLTGSIKVTKISSVDAGLSLQGAVYGVYSDSTCKTEVTTITTNAKGVGTATGLPFKTYYVKEKTAPTGYELDTQTYTAKVTGTTEVAVSSVDTPSSGYGYLVKKSSDSSVSGNSNYSLQNAVYGVYQTAANATAGKNSVGTLTTDANGKTNTLTLTPGTYYVRETTAPKGYQLDETNHTLTIKAGETTSITVEDKPVPGVAYIEKQNSNPDFTNVIPEYTLLNAVFGVYATKAEATAATIQNPGSPVHTFTTTIEVKDPAHPDYAAYKAESERAELLAGTYYVKELQAPDRFKPSDTVHTLYVNAGETKKVEIANDPYRYEETLEDELKIRILKKSGDGAMLSGASFLVEYYDARMDRWMDPYSMDPDAENASLSNILVTDSHGEIIFEKLPVGKYRITETAAPAGYSLLAESVIVDLPVKVSSSVSPDGADYTQDGYDFWLTYEMTVQDGQSIEMPFTGGVGVFLPVIGGTILTLTGGRMLRRKTEEE